MGDTPDRLRALLDEPAPSIAVPFSDTATPDDLRAARAQGLDVAEVRIDLFSTDDEDAVVAVVERFATLPTLATIRSVAEGGRWAGTEAARLALFRRVIPLVDAIDVELASSQIAADVVAAARNAGVLSVVSHHDFETTPPLARLREIAAEARAAGADLVKVATQASEPADFRTLAAFTLEEAQQGVIVVAMGSFGPASRVLFPVLGSRMTYAAGSALAIQGQLSLAETVDGLRRFSPEFADKLAVEAGNRNDR